MTPSWANPSNTSLGNTPAWSLGPASARICASYMDSRSNSAHPGSVTGVRRSAATQGCAVSAVPTPVGSFLASARLGFGQGDLCSRVFFGAPSEGTQQHQGDAQADQSDDDVRGETGSEAFGHLRGHVGVGAPRRGHG